MHCNKAYQKLSFCLYVCLSFVCLSVCLSVKEEEEDKKKKKNREKANIIDFTFLSKHSSYMHALRIARRRKYLCNKKRIQQKRRGSSSQKKNKTDRYKVSNSNYFVPSNFFDSHFKSIPTAPPHPSSPPAAPPTSALTAPSGQVVTRLVSPYFHLPSSAHCLALLTSQHTCHSSLCPCHPRPSPICRLVHCSLIRCLHRSYILPSPCCSV